MVKQTNIESLRGVLHSFLFLDIGKPFYGFCVEHPIIDYQTYFLDKKYYDVTTEDGLNVVRNHLKKVIENATTAFQCMAIVKKSYYLTFLKYAYPYLSVTDFSALLGEAWIMSENPNQDVNVSISLLLKWFKKAQKESLMDEEELEFYEKLPDVVTVYRGIGEKTNKNGLSWTLDLEKAKWFSRRFKSNGYVIQGKVQKQSILAFFDGREEKEVIIDPKTIEHKKELE